MRESHAFSCTINIGEYERHATINDVIQRSLQRAGISPTLEPNGLCRDDQKWPDGLTRFLFKNGRSLSWDCTCVDTFSQTNLAKCASIAGAAAYQAEKNKRAKYQEIAQRYLFELIAVESTGVYSPSTRKLINTIGRQIREVTGHPRETQWLKQRIGLVMQRRY